MPRRKKDAAQGRRGVQSSQESRSITRSTANYTSPWRPMIDAAPTIPWDVFWDGWVKVAPKVWRRAGR